jgi:DNA polymerase-1
MSEIRKCFTSRFDKGALFEIDYSQLEVAVLAFLTQDKTLIQDITDNLDMHLVSASWVTGVDYDILKKKFDSCDPVVIAQRKAAKQPRFELQYGAGPHTIAKNNGWALSKANDYIARYYERYPRVREWQEEVAATVEANAKVKTGWASLVNPERISYYKCPHTNRRYVFTTYPNKRGEHKFSPTQMKNYPVQGFATADLVPTVLGELVDVIFRNKLEEKTLLINTIHDSVLFDVTEDADMMLIYDVFDSTKKIMKEVYGVDINVPIRWSATVGQNWSEMK